jgi:hypothetical protein
MGAWEQGLYSPGCRHTGRSDRSLADEGLLTWDNRGRRKFLDMTSLPIMGRISHHKAPRPVRDDFVSVVSHVIAIHPRTWLIVGDTARKTGPYS